MPKSPPVGRSPEEISRIMRRVRSRNTSPEIAFRKALWANGLRYRLHATDLPGKPDIYLPGRRLALFVDGDYWHGGQWMRRGLNSLEDQFPDTPSKSYWLKKIRRNMERDCASTDTLLRDGWTVLRFWESAIQKNLEGCVRITFKAAQEGAPFSPFALLPRRTLFSIFPLGVETRASLEAQGWTVIVEGERKEGIAQVSLAIAVRDEPGVVTHTSTLDEAFGRGICDILNHIRPVRPPLLLVDSFLDTDAAPEDRRQPLQKLHAAGYVLRVIRIDSRSFLLGALDGVEGGTASRFVAERTCFDAAEATSFLSQLIEDASTTPIMPKKGCGPQKTSNIFEHVAERTLNPLVNELIRGRPLALSRT